MPDAEPNAQRAAMRAVEEAGSRLARVDANSFNLEQARAYLQASALARSARQALANRNFAAATQLGQQSSQLAGSLPGGQKLTR